MSFFSQADASATAEAPDASVAQTLAMRLFMASIASAELMVVYLGLRLGLYDVLARGPLTPPELAEQARIGARYAREWLEQQAAAGILEVLDPRQAANERRFRLPEGHRQALCDGGSPFHVAPLAVLPAGGIAPVLPRLEAAMRADEGIAYGEFGSELREAHGGMNRPVFDHHLAEWVRTSMADVHRRLRRGPATVADVGCGQGWSSLALARAYPAAHVHGIDLDAGAIASARSNTPDGLRARVEFTVADVATLADQGGYDLVCIFDSLHDMTRPVEVLAACRRLLAPGGSMLLMEPRVGEEFEAPCGDVERFLYAVSVLHCLPVGLAGPAAAGTGTVMRPATVQRYGSAAGFAGFAVLPVDHRFHRLYRLDP